MDRGVPRGRHRFGWAWRSAGRRWPTYQISFASDEHPPERRRFVRDLLELIPYPGDVTFHGGYRFEMLGRWPHVHVSPDDAPEE